METIMLIDRLRQETDELRAILYPLLAQLLEQDRAMLLRTQIAYFFKQYASTDEGARLKGSQIERIFKHTEEALAFDSRIMLSVRLDVADWHWVVFHTDPLCCEAISVGDFLTAKEVQAGSQSDETWMPELDLKPFEQGLPIMKEADSIGHGVEFLNKHLAHGLGTDEGRRQLLNFLLLHKYHNIPLLLNQQISDIPQLQQALRATVKHLRTLPPETEWKDFVRDLPYSCFEPGWGRTAEKTSKMMRLLLDILEAPAPRQLEDFLARIPMVSKLAILSPHGYFGQSNVLGLPDTGGQVVYILDQVRSLENQMRKDLYDQGLDIQPVIIVVTRLIPEAGDTTCNQRKEPIAGTESAYILRIPFRSETGEIIQHWISRFRIYPYLERFARDVEREILAEMGGRPDVVIGNYTDGNLVATLLTQSLNVTQCNIAHALEKTKYLYSALNWKEHEEEHHFSCQFTADLIAMNSADFIITSTYQEVAGTDHSIGQYESYTSFTMPDLYRVLHGVDIFDPKFNIISPGADAEVYFPYSNNDDRLTGLHKKISDIIYGPPSETACGELTDRDKPLIFAMSRLDNVKNVTGLVQWYADSPELQNEANLFLVAGKVNPADSSDAEERAQAYQMHEIIAENNLNNRVRWVNALSDKVFNGELYRVIADHHGIFVQPAHFEAFGLTVVEAMASGLPVFATCYGGPLEIIENGRSGFHIDPERGNKAAAEMLDFFVTARKDPQHWERFSDGALKRVSEAFTWDLYAKRMLSLSRIYGFWKHISHIERLEIRRYLEMFYAFIYRSRAALIPAEK
ncbi:MAG: sucrose synthase [Kiritimatiellia bacterium]